MTLVWIGDLLELLNAACQQMERIWNYCSGDWCERKSKMFTVEWLGGISDEQNEVIVEIKSVVRLSPADMRTRSHLHLRPLPASKNRHRFCVRPPRSRTKVQQSKHAATASSFKKKKSVKVFFFAPVSSNGSNSHLFSRTRAACRSPNAPRSDGDESWPMKPAGRDNENKTHLICLSQMPLCLHFCSVFVGLQISGLFRREPRGWFKEFSHLAASNYGPN